MNEIHKMISGILLARTDNSDNNNLVDYVIRTEEGIRKITSYDSLYKPGNKVKFQLMYYFV